jgi:protein-S-isoprenylcysteine O-methyltransferase Ste14
MASASRQAIFTKTRMKNATGQILRAVGLLIELLGVLAVMAQSRTNEVARVPIPGGSVSLGWLAVGAGFVIWLAGRIIILRGDRARLSQRRARRLNGDPE